MLRLKIKEVYDDPEGVSLVWSVWKEASDVAEALGIIDKRYASELTVLAIAQELHIHPTYLHKLFREETGHSVCEYIQHVRLEHARRLLGENYTLRDAAAAVGISSPQYFSKLFKRAYGMTPGESRVRGKLGGHGV